MQINYHNSQDNFSLLVTNIDFYQYQRLSPFQDKLDELNSEDELNFEFRDPINSSDEENEGEHEEDLFLDAPEEEASDEDDDDQKTVVPLGISSGPSNPEDLSFLEKLFQEYQF